MAERHLDPRWRGAVWAVLYDLRDLIRTDGVVVLAGVFYGACAVAVVVLLILMAFGYR
jgi:hypothetical protein